MSQIYNDGFNYSKHKLQNPILLFLFCSKKSAAHRFYDFLHSIIRLQYRISKVTTANGQ